MRVIKKITRKVDEKTKEKKTFTNFYIELDNGNRIPITFVAFGDYNSYRELNLIATLEELDK